MGDIEDIVWRLRNPAGRFYGHTTMADAADEIESLRARNAELVEGIKDALLFEYWDEGHAQDKLRAALAKQGES